MQDFTIVTGMIIKAVPIGEYDRRLVLLTKERGKISAFAKGARKPNSRFVATTDLFCFGTFRLYTGRSSYTVAEAEISNYFEELRMDFEGACYGMYFLEIADYYTRENNDEKEMLKLLYQSLKAIVSTALHNPLVRAVYELKAVIVNGEFPGIPSKKQYLPATEYTISYILNSPIEKLYTFTLTDEVLSEIKEIAAGICQSCLLTRFHSLEILDTL